MNPEEVARKVGEGESWIGESDKKSASSANPVSEQATETLDYDPALVVGGPTLYEDSAVKPASPREIVGILPKDSREAANLAAPLHEPGAPADAKVPEAELPVTPITPEQLSMAKNAAGKDTRAEDFAAYATDIEIPMLTYPGPPKPRPNPAALSKIDSQDLHDALTDDQQAAGSLAAGFLSAKMVEQEAPKGERGSALSGAMFDGTGAIPGNIKAVFDMSSVGVEDDIIVNTWSNGGDSGTACNDVKEKAGREMLALGHEMGTLGQALRETGAPGCCQYSAIDSWSRSMLRMSQLCDGFNSALSRVSIACGSPYQPYDCSKYRPQQLRAVPARCLALFIAGITILIGGALFASLGPAYVVFGSAVASGALLGGAPGLLLCVAGVLSALTLHGPAAVERHRS
ncbi:MAG: hypothetical protein GX410_09385 [Elusimicrobia bacterium]|nr:hypothetical protein [Elusimicrobiota bacterium]